MGDGRLALCDGIPGAVEPASTTWYTRYCSILLLYTLIYALNVARTLEIFVLAIVQLK